MYICLLSMFVITYLPVLWKTCLFLYYDSSFVPTYPDFDNNPEVHQIFGLFDDEMPAEWKACSTSWHRFSHHMWNKSQCVEAIIDVMPNRRELIDYDYVQLSDVCRVAILYLHGGVYVDMDICAETHTRIPKCDACFVKTSPGVSNDIMIVKKHHPVLKNILYAYADAQWMNRFFYVPYIRTMFTTGPVQLSLAVQNYPFTKTVTYASMSVKHIHGSSWHSWDAIVFMHPIISICTIIILIFIYGYTNELILYMRSEEFCS